MALTLPASPTLNQTYTLGSKTWIWNGSSWRATVTASTVASYDTSTTSTGFFSLPAGTTAQRPSTPNVGMSRWNTTLSVGEMWMGSVWFAYVVSSYSIDYLIVGGGGAGGAGTGGVCYPAGGAGGNVVVSNTIATPGINYAITVGAGGAATGGNGGSSIIQIGGTITAVGGNGAGAGFAGANNLTYLGAANGGGSTAAGGGAGGGGNASNMNGGIGYLSSISGTSTYYAGGGAGMYGSGAGSGGLGGGGSTSYGATNPGTNGTGGGGGGSSAGGSGIVILRYPSTYNAAASTGSPTIVVANGYRTYTWTTSGSITF